MHPTTVILKEATQKNLQKLAKQQGKTTDEIVQEAIEFYLLAMQKQQPKSSGIGKSNSSDLSERVDVTMFEMRLHSQLVDRRAFMKLPLEERRQILAEQAKVMAQHYEQDPAWREWVNFDVGEIHDEFQTW